MNPINERMKLLLQQADLYGHFLLSKKDIKKGRKINSKNKNSFKRLKKNQIFDNEK